MGEPCRAVARVPGSDHTSGGGAIQHVAEGVGVDLHHRPECRLVELDAEHGRRAENGA
jgi:hypothetical protein